MATIDHVVRAGDGCRIAVHGDGPADAPALILASSLGTTAGMWQPNVAALAARFRVLRLDTRGHGGSDAPDGDYTLARLGTDVLDVLDALGIERAHVCGVSLGGMIGQWLGAHAPGRVDRLVLANTASIMGPPSGWDERLATVRRDGMSALVDALLGRWLTPAFRASHPEEEARLRAMVVGTSPVGYAGCCAAIRDMDLRADLARITAPTLLITGTADPATPPATAEAIADAMRVRPRIVALEAAHLASVEQPRAFERAVVEHLS